MNRRDFMKSSSLFLMGLSFGSLAKTAKALAAAAPATAGKPACSDADPVAKALGYKDVAKNIDTKAYAQFKPLKKEHNCAHCALYQAIPAAKGWGNCTMLANCAVSEKGLCGSWQLKKA